MNLTKYIAPLTLLVISLVYVPQIPTILIEAKEKSVRIQDFAYHLLIYKGLWTGQIDNPYQFENQVLILRHESSSNISTAMPIGQSPVALLLSYPFTLIAQYNLLISYFLWLTISSACLACGLNQWRKETNNNNIYFPLFTLITILSVAFLHAFELGQTSIIALGILLLFAGRTNEEKCYRWISVLGNIVLAIKPPYFFLGVSFLLAERKLKNLFYSTFVVGIILGSTVWLLPSRWIPDYLSNLASYTAEPSSHYQSSIVTKTMTSVPQILASLNIVDPKLLYSTSTIIFFGGTLCFLIALLPPLTHETKRLVSIASILFYVTFAPYVGFYEDLLVLIPVLGIISYYPKSSRAEKTFIGLALVIILNWPVLKDSLNSSLGGFFDVDIFMRGLASAMKLSLLFIVFKRALMSLKERELIKSTV